MMSPTELLEGPGPCQSLDFSAFRTSSSQNWKRINVCYCKSVRFWGLLQQPQETHVTAGVEGRGVHGSIALWCLVYQERGRARPCPRELTSGEPGSKQPISSQHVSSLRMHTVKAPQEEADCSLSQLQVTSGPCGRGRGSLRFPPGLRLDRHGGGRSQPVSGRVEVGIHSVPVWETQLHAQTARRPIGEDLSLF